MKMLSGPGDFPEGFLFISLPPQKMAAGLSRVAGDENGYF